MDWSDFLNALKDGIDVMEGRLERGDAPVRYVSAINRSPVCCEIMIGIGKHGDSGGVCLNNKGVPPEYHGKQTGYFDSVTRLVIESTEPCIALWKHAIVPPSFPPDIFRKWCLLVEDASPDSCFGLICFLARCSGVVMEQIPVSWIRYIQRWEGGHKRVRGNPAFSYGPLQSSLYHSLIPSNEEGRPLISDDASWGKAWISCLRLTLAALAGKCQPDDLSPIDMEPEFIQARSQFDYEAQEYRINLERNVVCAQLLLPIKDSPNRKKLVDAYFEQEESFAGAKTLS